MMNSNAHSKHSIVKGSRVRFMMDEVLYEGEVMLLNKYAHNGESMYYVWPHRMYKDGFLSKPKPEDIRAHEFVDDRYLTLVKH